MRSDSVVFPLQLRYDYYYYYRRERVIAGVNEKVSSAFFANEIENEGKIKRRKIRTCRYALKYQYSCRSVFIVIIKINKNKLLIN